jgi:hypothetical protein
MHGYKTFLDREAYLQIIFIIYLLLMIVYLMTLSVAHTIGL